MSLMKAERVNIYLTERLLKILGRKAKELGISRSELIRRILDEWAEK